MVDAHDRRAVLEERLKLPDVTIDEVREFIMLAHPPLQGQVPQLLTQYVTEQDLAHFWTLRAWWEPVHEKPMVLPTPEIRQFCWHINHSPENEPITFGIAMYQWWQRAHKFCVDTNLDPQNPGESPADRKRRLNRERMALARGHKTVSSKALAANPELAAQVRGLETQAEMLKQQMDGEYARLSEDVKGHQARMQAAADERKAMEVDFKQRIDNIRAEIRTLIAKQ